MTIKVTPVVLGQVGRPHRAIALVNVNANVGGLAPFEEVMHGIEGKRAALNRARIAHAVDGAAVERDHVGAVE